MSNTALPEVKIRFTPSLQTCIALVGQPEGFEGDPDQFSDAQSMRMEEEAGRLLEAQQGDWDAEIDY